MPISNPESNPVFNFIRKFLKTKSVRQPAGKQIWTALALLTGGLLLTLTACLLLKADVEQDAKNEFDFACTVHADEAMLNTILRNLLSNAVKFTRQGGKVIVRAAETENNMMEISVTDSGIGMSEDLSQKLFKVDEKVGRKGTDGESSTGLGLLLCKEFVEKHGGRIRVESGKGKGSTFYFTIPVA